MRSAFVPLVVSAVLLGCNTTDAGTGSAEGEGFPIEGSITAMLSNSVDAKTHQSQPVYGVVREMLDTDRGEFAFAAYYLLLADHPLDCASEVVATSGGGVVGPFPGVNIYEGDVWIARVASAEEPSPPGEYPFSDVTTGIKLIVPDEPTLSTDHLNDVDFTLLDVSDGHVTFDVSGSTSTFDLALEVFLEVEGEVRVRVCEDEEERAKLTGI